MALKLSVRVQEADFTLQELSDDLALDEGKSGALTLFVGMVRDYNHQGDIDGLFLEHYPGMTERSLHQIAEKAAERWPLDGVSIVHRIGELKGSDNIVGVAVSAAHRKAAYEANQFIMDYLKTQAPFWKKELRGEDSVWVEAKESDQQARERWK